MEVNTTTIIVYGTTWCPDSWLARRVLDEHEVAYRWVDIDTDPVARAYVEEVNGGYRSVPTIRFPDGSLLVEPSRRALQAKLNDLAG